MRKSLFLLFAIVILCFSCKDATSSPPQPSLEITSIEVLDMMLVVDREVPILINNQDNVNVTNLVDINAANPEKASVSSNGVVMAKVAGDIEIIVSYKDFSETVTLESVTEDTTLENIGINILQSPSHYSPYVDMEFSGLKGVVTGKAYKAFYLQSLEPDNFPETSEGILIYYNATAPVTPGDIVILEGEITEYIYYKNKYTTSLSTTQLKIEKDSIIKDGTVTVPDGVDLSVRIPPNEDLSDNGNLNNYSHIFDCHNKGIDFWESVEGMLVTVNNPLVVSPYAYGDFFIVDRNGENSIGLNDRKNLLINENNQHPNKIAINVKYDGGNNAGSTYGVNIGDSFLGSITAPVNLDTYFKSPILDAQYIDTSDFYSSKINSSNAREETEIINSSNELTVASFNIENYNAFDSHEDKTEDISETIVNGLKCPDIIALAEMQDDDGTFDDENSSVTSATNNANTLIAAIKTAGGIDYTYTDIAPAAHQDGGIPGGNIRVGYLFNPLRVSLAENTKGDEVTSVVVSNASGAIELNHNPVRIITDAFDGSRKPLLTEFVFNGKSVYMINVHFSSKRSDDAAWGYKQPPELKSEVARMSQCESVKTVIDNLLEVDENANIIVLGDFNDFTWSNPIKTLMGNKLKSLVDIKLSESERYSYNFMGNAQQLDHILVTKNLTDSAKVDIVHRYCEFWNQETDHDPIVASILIN